jgi:hypothetical protein
MWLKYEMISNHTYFITVHLFSKTYEWHSLLIKLVLVCIQNADHVVYTHTSDIWVQSEKYHLPSDVEPVACIVAQDRPSVVIVDSVTFLYHHDPPYHVTVYLSIRQG